MVERDWALPSRGQAHIRRQHEHDRDRARTDEAMRDLAAAIRTGDDSLRRLRHGFDEYDAGLEAVASGLRQAGYLRSPHANAE